MLMPFGAAFLIFFAFTAWQKFEVGQHGRRTLGTVEHIWHGKSAYSTYTFWVQDRGLFKGQGNSRHEPGDRISVLYDPNDPNVNFAEEQIAPWLELTMSAFGAVLLAFGYKALRDGRRAAWR